jgi:hypothetical protein
MLAPHDYHANTAVCDETKGGILMGRKKAKRRNIRLRSASPIRKAKKEILV